MFFKSIKEQKGSSLLITMIILVLVTIIGIAAIGNSVFNLKMAGNIKDIEESFYKGESITYKACTEIWKEDNIKLRDHVPKWIHSTEEFHDLGYGFEPVFIDDDELVSLLNRAAEAEPEDSDYSLVSAETEAGEDLYGENWNSLAEKAEYICFYNGTSGSQDITSGNSLHQYVVFARYRTVKGGVPVQRIFEIGYRKKF